MPGTDRERIQIELQKFEKECANLFMRLLTDGITNGESGFVRMSVKLEKGQMVTLQTLTDYSKPLDGNGRR